VVYIEEMELLEWDARAYDSLPLPHKHWGTAAIARLELAGNETVLDLGCGTGRDAQALLSILPTGRVIAVDGSQQMLDEARARLADSLDRVEIVHADLRQPLDLAEPADAALSVATLHWLPDHAAAFRSVAASLRPGARFVAESGGAGNIAVFRKALREVSGADGSEVWNFADVESTRHELEGAGFTDIHVRLVADPARLNRGVQLEAFLATVMLGAQLRDLPAEEHRPFVHDVAERLPEPVIDYVRLQLEAVRA
jgi:trans-aconitate 2-methyltransferase